jgi:hypothetical protein
MKYMLLIYESETWFAGLTEAERQALYAEYRDFSGQIAASGNLLDGSELQPSTTATVVHVEQGRTLTTDGPFAETREQLGGYYLVEAKDLDEAVALAARIPSARTGHVEVRPLMPSQMP